MAPIERDRLLKAEEQAPVSARSCIKDVLVELVVCRAQDDVGPASSDTVIGGAMLVSPRLKPN